MGVSFVKPTLYLFTNSLLEVQEDDTALAKSIKGKIVGYISDKYSDEQLKSTTWPKPRTQGSSSSMSVKTSVVEDKLRTEMKSLMTAMVIIIIIIITDVLNVQN